MPLKTQTDELPSMNLTSMLDVLFLLIIFFMAGTKFTEMERKIALRVPQVSDHGALTAAPEKRIVNIYQDGQITLDRQSVTLDELRARLTAARGQYRDLGVLVRGDAAGAFQNVAQVLNACKQAGINELAISVRVGTQKR
ncbi:MAG TPA: biopolymer transporter ExbD [Pirellulales bacterium]|jgi:biopolymer transport protein ExbD|nr:biopolymer transporter ExbD [Pirellulales bacterium]